MLKEINLDFLCVSGPMDYDKILTCLIVSVQFKQLFFGVLLGLGFSFNKTVISMFIFCILYLMLLVLGMHSVCVLQCLPPTHTLHICFLSRFE